MSSSEKLVHDDLLLQVEESFARYLKVELRAQAAYITRTESHLEWLCLKSPWLSLEEVSTTCGSGWVRSRATTAQSSC